MSSKDSPLPTGKPLPLAVLKGEVVDERKFGYLANGKKKRILLNAFDMNGVGHISVGQWQNPEDHSAEKNRLGYWIELAKLLEKGKFNALFLADNFGSHDVYEGSHAPAIRAGTQWPLYDPFVIIPPMAAVTKSLAFGITACTTFEPPFLLAKRFSTLDHVTEGRVAWNIVTSWSDNAARALGLEKLPEHDDRYAIAEEYLELVYKLWEGSWADGAVVKDTVTHTFADPAKVRKIEHHGKYFNSVSAHQVDPSPQRTPVLFQAGMSPAGAAFAAKHAECIFVGGPNPAIVARSIADTRARAAAAGRNPADIRFFVQFTPVLGATDAEAEAKAARYREYAILDGGLALFGGITGIDVSVFDWDEPFPADPQEPRIRQLGLSPSQHQRLLARPTGFTGVWGRRALAEFRAYGGAGPFKIGSGATVADELERWITEADVDGFNIGHVVVPGAWQDVIDFLIPELERRGWLGESAHHEYLVPGGTARENLYGTPGDAHLRPGHPGLSFRFRSEAAESAESAKKVTSKSDPVDK